MESFSIATALQTVSRAGGILSRDLKDLFLKVVTVNAPQLHLHAEMRW